MIFNYRYDKEAERSASDQTYEGRNNENAWAIRALFTLFSIILSVYIASISHAYSVYTWDSGEGANGHSYQVVNAGTGVNWWAAEAAAENGTYSDISGHLVTITSSQEEAFVYNMIAETEGTAKWYWLGGIYVDTSWTWVTGETLDYTDWASGQPSGTGAIRFYNSNWYSSTAGDSTMTRYIVETVPVPGAVWLLGSGLIGIVGFRKKFRKEA